jgi:hypothetical protein
VAAAATIGSERSDLHGAKVDAFNSVVALAQARSVAYDANADESRYLIDPAGAGQYQQAFLDKSLEITGLPAGTTIANFDATLAPDVTAAAAGKVNFTGYLGTELNNITFPGERRAALDTLRNWGVYQTDDRILRKYETTGQHAQAIHFDTSTDPGQSNYAFYQFDTAGRRAGSVGYRALHPHQGVPPVADPGPRSTGLGRRSPVGPLGSQPAESCSGDMPANGAIPASFPPSMGMIAPVI